jgi:hypothetical protein
MENSQQFHSTTNSSKSQYCQIISWPAIIYENILASTKSDNSHIVLHELTGKFTILLLLLLLKEDEMCKNFKILRIRLWVVCAVQQKLLWARDKCWPRICVNPRSFKNLRKSLYWYPLPRCLYNKVGFQWGFCVSEGSMVAHKGALMPQNG